jgi:hypothetical protein
MFMCAIARWSASVGEAFHAVSPAAITLRGYAEAMAAWFGRGPKLRYLPWSEWKEEQSELEAAVHPDRTGMQKMSHLSAPGFHQMPRARLREADHVDDDIGPQFLDFPAEGASVLLSFAGQSNRAHEFPGGFSFHRPLSPVGSCLGSV